MKTKTSLSNYILIALFVITFIGLSLLFIIMPDRDFSENENRVLKEFPVFSFKALWSGEYTSDLSEYCSDQFPVRDFFVNIKSATEIAMLKGSVNGIVPGQDGYLITDLEISNKEQIKENLSHIGAFADKTELPVYLAFAPTSAEINRDKLPALYPMGELDKFHAALLESLPESTANIDLYTPLLERASEYIYYKTDHHWTTLGAYYAYREIIISLGGTPYSLEDFIIEEVSENFYGTTWSFAGIPFVKPDSIEFFRFDGDGDFVCEIGKNEKRNGLYDFAALDTKDKYSAFIANTINGKIKISGGEDRETIVLIKDSFAHSIAPFLARHYNIVMLDLRYHTVTKGSIDKLLEEENASAVLFLMGSQGIYDTSGKLEKLRLN